MCGFLSLLEEVVFCPGRFAFREYLPLPRTCGGPSWWGEKSAAAIWLGDAMGTVK